MDHKVIEAYVKKYDCTWDDAVKALEGQLCIDECTEDCPDDTCKKEEKATRKTKELKVNKKTK